VRPTRPAGRHRAGLYLDAARVEYFGEFAMIYRQSRHNNNNLLRNTRLGLKHKQKRQKEAFRQNEKPSKALEYKIDRIICGPVYNARIVRLR